MNNEERARAALDLAARIEEVLPGGGVIDLDRPGMEAQKALFWEALGNLRASPRDGAA